MIKKTKNKLLLIASIGFLIAGIIFLCLNIFTEEKNNTYLCIALADITLGNVFNIIRDKKIKD